MPTKYSIAAAVEAREMLAAVVHKWHRSLHDAGVTWDVLMASNDTGPAVKSGGNPVAVDVRIANLIARVKGARDVEVVIDLAWWDNASAKHRRALLDHAAIRIELAKIKGYDPETGEISCARDDVNRPKLAKRKGDWCAGNGYRNVVERHGEWAVEFENLNRCFTLAKAAAHGEAEPNHEEGKEPDL